MSPLLLVGLALALSAPTPPPAGPDPRLHELVRKLGDRSFRAREDAARTLLRQGSAAVAALTAGLKHPDPEVSERCRLLLPQAAALERNEKLNALLKDPAAPPPKGLAGLDRFLKATGDTPAARELYAELMRIHARTVEAADTDPRAAAAQYSEFCQEAYTRSQASARGNGRPYDNVFSGQADITFFLFLSADHRVRKTESGVQYAYVLLYGNQIPKALSEKDGNPALRKLFLNWLEHEPQSYMQQQGFQLAANANLKEALPLLLKLIDKKDANTYSRAQVIASLPKLGGKEHIRVLDQYLTDTTSVGKIQFGNAGGGVQSLEVQLRDVAMGVQIQMSGQKLADYGIENRFGGGGSYYSYGFPDDEARAAAHKKWQEWRAKNLTNGKEPKPPAKSGPPAKASQGKR